MMSALLAGYLSVRWSMLPEVLDSATAIMLRHEAGEKLDALTIAGVVEGRRESETIAIRESLVLGPESLVASAGGDGGGGGGDRLYAVRNGVAIVPVGGVVAKYANQVNGASQPRGTSTQAIMRAVGAAAADESVHSILLMIDSPGGMVSGVQTATDYIRKVDTTIKPVWAFADDLMASAGYWLASGARRIESTPGATVGSIGVYAPIWDSSKRAEQQGYKVHVVKAGAKKGGIVEGAPISGDALSNVQAEIDAIYSQFVGAVAAGRPGLSAEKVLELADGGVRVGPAALAAGLVDAQRSVDAVIADMSKQYGQANKGNSGPMRLGSSTGTGAAASAQPGAKKGGDMDPATLAEAAGAAGGVVGSVAGASGADVLTAERARVAAVQAAGVPFAHVAGVDSLIKKEISTPSVSMMVFQAALLALVAAGTQPLANAGVDVQVGASGQEQLTQDISTQLMVRINPNLETILAGRPGHARDAQEQEQFASQAQSVAASLGLATPAAFAQRRREATARGAGRMTVLDMMAACVRSNSRAGGRLPNLGSDDQIIRAAVGGMSTGDFPYLLENVANKFLEARFTTQPSIWQLICRKGSARDFKQRSLVSLSETGNLSLIPEGQSAPFIKQNERKATGGLSTHGAALKLTRQAIINDDLGGFSQSVMAMSERADLRPDQLLYEKLAENSGNGPTMADGYALFNAANHLNLAGSAAALSETTLEAAVTAFMGQKGFGADQDYINVEPKVLLVPHNLWRTANLLCNNPTTILTTNANSNVRNVFAGRLRDVWAARLAAISTTGWYLFADPLTVPTFEMAFLNGNERPSLAPINTENPLALEFVMYFDVEPTVVNFEGAYKNAGA